MTTRRATTAVHVAGAIVDIIRRERLEPGTHLGEQRLADELGLSRGPIRAALKALADTGVVTTEGRRGYTLAVDAQSPVIREALEASEATEDLYRRVAAERLDGMLPDVVSEAELMRRYGVSRAALTRLLDRIATEGWIRRQTGYGWRFADTLTSPDAGAQLIAFRSTIEPAALLVPGYALSARVINRLRHEQAMFAESGFGGRSFSDMFQSGCEFHEALAAGAPNPFYLDALKRVNSLRRLLSYRNFADKTVMVRHFAEHLTLLDLIEARRLDTAADLLKRHLQSSPVGGARPNR